MWTHSELPLQVGGGLGSPALLLALQGAQGADVAPGRPAVVPQHLVIMIWAFPVREVPQRIDQGVPGEHRQLQVVFDVIFTKRDFTLEACFDGQGLFVRAAVTVNPLWQLDLLPQKHMQAVILMLDVIITIVDDTFEFYTFEVVQWQRSWELPFWSYSPWSPARCWSACSSSAPQWSSRRIPDSLDNGRECLQSNPAGFPGSSCTGCVRREAAVDRWRYPDTPSMSTFPQASSPCPPLLTEVTFSRYRSEDDRRELYFRTPHKGSSKCSVLSVL